MNLFIENFLDNDTGLAALDRFVSISLSENLSGNQASKLYLLDLLISL